MTEFFGSLFWMLVSLGLLVNIHELGHYAAARLFGIRVLRFSFGWGSPLWKRTDRTGTEWAIAPFLVGGYVQMLDDRAMEVTPDELPESLNAKPVWQRMVVLAAGPLANLALCVALLWLMFVIGKPDVAPQVSLADGPAAVAGIREGDRILAVGDRDTPTWTDAAGAMAFVGMDRVAVPVRVRGLDGREREVVLPFDAIPEGTRPQDVVAAIGLREYLPARIGQVMPGTAAEGRLQAGDLVLALGGREVGNYYRLGPLLQALAAPGDTVVVTVERDGRRLDVPVDPRLSGSGPDAVWRLGTIASDPREIAVLRYGPLQAVPQALRTTAQLASDTLGLLGRIVVGRASLENVSGPVTIARAANVMAGVGPAWFLNFLAVLSLGLCIINLLPVPVLDGGHLLYYLIELAKGSPVGENARVAGQFLGLAMIAGLMGLAFYNDLFRPGF